MRRFYFLLLSLVLVGGAVSLARADSPAPAAAPPARSSPIRIISAFWGSNAKILDVRDAVAQKIAGDKLTFTVLPMDLGADPGGKGKKLTLVYELNGVRQTKSFKGDAQVSLSVGTFPSVASIKNLIPQEIRKIAPENWQPQDVSAVNEILDTHVAGGVFTGEITVKTVDASPDVHRAGRITTGPVKLGTLRWQLIGDVAVGGEKALDAIHSNDKIVVAGIVRQCRLVNSREAREFLS